METDARLLARKSAVEMERLITMEQNNVMMVTTTTLIFAIIIVLSIAGTQLSINWRNVMTEISSIPTVVQITVL